MLKIPIEYSTALADVWFDQIYQNGPVQKSQRRRSSCHAVVRERFSRRTALVMLGYINVASIITKHCTVAAWPSAMHHLTRTKRAFVFLLQSKAQLLSYLKCKQENNEIRSIGLEGDQRSTGG